MRARPCWRGRVPAAIALSLLVLSRAGAAQETVPAVWKEQQLVFHYSSSNVVYSCSTLRDRVASILYAVGARPDMDITLGDCSVSAVPAPQIPSSIPVRRPGEPGLAAATSQRTDRRQFVYVRVRLSIPVEMTPEVIAELRTDKSRRELISRATGDPLPRFDDPIPFAAQRKIVTLSHDTIGLEPAECELLDQISTSTFRSLGVRVVQRAYNCDRTGTSHIPPRIDVEALVAGSAESNSVEQAPTPPDPGAPEAAGSESREPPGAQQPQ